MYACVDTHTHLPLPFVPRISLKSKNDISCCKTFSTLCHVEYLNSCLTNPSTFYSAILSLTVYTLSTKCMSLLAHIMLFHTSLPLCMLVLCLKLLSSLIFEITPYSIHLSSSPGSLSGDPTAKENSEQYIILFSSRLTIITGRDLFTVLHSI